MPRRKRRTSYPSPSSNLPAVTVEMVFDPPPFIKPQRRRGAKAEGVRYEAKVHKHLAEVCEYYAPAPWLYAHPNGTQDGYWRQPDGWIVDIPRGKITIVEVKVRHTDAARTQLRLGYEPLVRRLFGEDHWQYSCLEVVKWFDPHTYFGEAFRMVRDPAAVDPGWLGVYVHRA